MNIIIAKNAGFCFGVSRCINLVLNVCKNQDKEIYTYGPVIHNSEVIKRLSNNGVKILNDFENVDLRKKIVVIRSHGVSQLVMDRLYKKQACIIDATCPFVFKIHKIVEHDSIQGNEIIIIGNPNHPEIIGIKGCSKNKVHIIEDIESARLFDLDKNIKFSIVVQTTFNKNNFLKIIDILNSKGYNIYIYDTICHASKSMYEEALKIASKVDLMIVIGDKKSSNTLKLYDICSKLCSNTYHIETVKDLNCKWFVNVLNVGITAGASTPKYIIEEVQNYVRNKF